MPAQLLQQHREELMKTAFKVGASALVISMVASATFAQDLQIENEDWWRNPSARQWLQGLFARGGTDDADTLCREISGKDLTLPEAGDRLVALLNR